MTLTDFGLANVVAFGPPEAERATDDAPMGWHGSSFGHEDVVH
jgi:hypothetical protein